MSTLKEEELTSVGELSQVCSQIVLKFFFNTLHGLEDLIFLGSVNKLARSITKWAKVCDKRLNRLIPSLRKIIAVLTRCRSIVFELKCSRNACNFVQRRVFLIHF